MSHLLLVCRQFILCLVAPLTQVPNFHYWGSLTLTTSYVSRQNWLLARVFSYIIILQCIDLQSIKQAFSLCVATSDLIVVNTEQNTNAWSIYFSIVLIRKYFQHLCGTDPHPVQFRAKKYKLDQRFMEKKDFMEMMQVKFIIPVHKYVV